MGRPPKRAAYLSAPPRSVANSAPFNAFRVRGCPQTKRACLVHLPWFHEPTSKSLPDQGGDMEIRPDPYTITRPRAVLRIGLASSLAFLATIATLGTARADSPTPGGFVEQATGNQVRSR